MKTSCVHEKETPVIIFGRCIVPVSRDAREISHEGPALSDEAVEEPRFPDVWAPDDGNHGMCHDCCSSVQWSLT